VINKTKTEIVSGILFYLDSSSLLSLRMPTFAIIFSVVDKILILSLLLHVFYILSSLPIIKLHECSVIDSLIWAFQVTKLTAVYS